MNSPRYELSDGTYASLHALVLKPNYQRGLSGSPFDPEIELRRLAKAQLPTQWRPAPLTFLSPNATGIGRHLRLDLLPEVLCIGHFCSTRPAAHGHKGKAVWRNIAWLQERLERHMDVWNREIFRRLNWEVFAVEKAIRGATVLAPRSAAAVARSTPTAANLPAREYSEEPVMQGTAQFEGVWQAGL